MKKILFLVLMILALPIAFACGDEGHDNAITGDNVAGSCDIGSGSGMMGGKYDGFRNDVWIWYDGKHWVWFF